MPNDMRRVAGECRANGGLIKESLGDLRAEIGYDRLGNWVQGYIAEALKKQGLGYFPVAVLDPRVNVRPRKEHTIWIYDAAEGSLLAQVAEIINDPNGYRDEDVFNILGGLSGSDADVLRHVRRLLLPRN